MTHHMKPKTGDVFTQQQPGTPKALVALSTHTPAEALTASLLGTERSGHGIVIRDDGLILTIGYLVAEAESAWIQTHTGEVAPGYVIGYDHESGLGLIKASAPLGIAPVPIGHSKHLPLGANAWIGDSRDAGECAATQVVARREFAGRWEYLIDDAIFTAPPHTSWAGAALLDDYGCLCGVGSLLLQVPNAQPGHNSVNMFVPIELILPYLDELVEYGARQTPARPWIGAMVQDDDARLVVAGVYNGCPADAAGLMPGDIIVSVGGRSVSKLAGLFRRIWSIGPAGVEIPMTVIQGGEVKEIRILSADRNLFHWRGTIN